MKCHIIEFDAVDWSVLDRFADRTVFQTREWIQFIRQSQNATPVIAELREGREVAGYFTGLTFTRLGIKILGSSFPGWTTPYIRLQSPVWRITSDGARCRRRNGLEQISSVST